MSVRSIISLFFFCGVKVEAYSVATVPPVMPAKKSREVARPQLGALLHADNKDPVVQDAANPQIRSVHTGLKVMMVILPLLPLHAAMGQKKCVAA